MIIPIIPILSLVLATVLVSLGVFEIFFPDAFSITNFNFVLKKFPMAWKYNMHIGIAQTILGALFIIPAWNINKAFTARVLEVLIRLGIGGMFIFASIDKIASPKAFAILVAQYQFLPSNLVNLWALILPQLEFWFGLALIATPYVRECTWVILGLFAAFIIALIWALALKLDIVCGCFSTEVVSGAQSSSEAWVALIRDLVLLWPTIWLLTRRNKNLFKDQE